MNGQLAAKALEALGTDWTGPPNRQTVRAALTCCAAVCGPHGQQIDDREDLYAEAAHHLHTAGVDIPPFHEFTDPGPVLHVTVDGEQWAVDTDGEWTQPETAPAATELTAGGMLVAWDGVLCVEGKPTGDGRVFKPGSLTWDETLMPQDLFAMLQDPDGGDGHDGAVICGRIDRMWREPHPTETGVNLIRGEGVFDTASPTGAEVARLQGLGMLKGVSVDIDSAAIVASKAETPLGALLGEGVQTFDKGRIRRATVCSIPAFIEARIHPTEHLALVAGAEISQAWTAWTPVDRWGQETATLVASAFGDLSAPFTSPVIEHPPGAVFARKVYDRYTPATIDQDGIISGMVVPFSECHIGFGDRCVTVTGSDNAYRYARTGHVLTRENDLVPTARVYAQWSPNLRAHAAEQLNATDAVQWYESMSQAVADVAIYDDQFGMQIQGRVRPGITQHQLVALRASDLSPDWRAINGRRECLAIAAVNVSGFPSRYDQLPALVASAVAAGLPIPEPTAMTGTVWVEDGMVLTLVASAAGINRPDPFTVLAARLNTLEQAVAAMTAERLAGLADAVLAGLGEDLAQFIEGPITRRVAALETEMAGCKRDMAKLKQNMSMMKKKKKKMDMDMAADQADGGQLAAGDMPITERVSMLEADLTQMRKDMAAMHKNAGGTELAAADGVVELVPENPLVTRIAAIEDGLAKMRGMIDSMMGDMTAERLAAVLDGLDFDPEMVVVAAAGGCTCQT